MPQARASVEWAELFKTGARREQPARASRTRRAPRLRSSRMKLVRLLGSTLFMVLALGIVTASSASASTFLSHPPGLLLAAVLGAQLFGTLNNSIECDGASLLNSKTTQLQFLNLLVTVQWENCKVVNYVSGGFEPVTYLISADGLVSQVNSASFFGARLCTVTFPSSKNQNLEKALYINETNGELLLLLLLKGLTAEGCLSSGGKGTLLGRWTVRVDGGTLSWMP